MKKITYGIITIFMLLILPINVFAASFTVSTDELVIEEGGTAEIKVVTNDAIVRANVVSKDVNVATVEKALWVSDSAGKEKEIENKIKVTAVGAVGKTTQVTVEIFDASGYTPPEVLVDPTDESSWKKHTINVKIVEKAAGAEPKTEYTVKYNANGGKNAPADQKKIEKEELTLSTEKPVYDGHEFLGWNTQQDGKGTSYAAGGKYTEDKDLVLYAQWKQTGNVKKNPQTGDTMVYVVLLLTLGALIYSYWYMKKSQEN